MDAMMAAVGLFARENTLLVLGGVYIGAILGGNVAAFAAFWVAFATDLENWRIMALLGTVALAQFSGDMIWFNLGRGLRNTKFGGWIERQVPGHDRAEDALQKNGRRFLYISKFAYGSAGLVIFSLGWTGMKFRDFIKNSAMSICMGLPVVFLMAYGLFSGLSPLNAVAAFKHLEILFLAGIAAFIVLQWLLSKAVKVIFSDKNGE